MHPFTKTFHGTPSSHPVHEHGASVQQPMVQICQFQHYRVCTTHRLHRKSSMLSQTIDVHTASQCMSRAVPIGIKELLSTAELILKSLLPLLQISNDLLLLTFLSLTHTKHSLIRKLETGHGVPTRPVVFATCCSRTDVVANSTSCRQTSG